MVVYQPLRSTAVWGAEYTTTLDAIKSICECDVYWPPHGVYRPKADLSSEVRASNAALVGSVVMSPHSDVAWLEPHMYCWVPVAAKEDGVTNVAVVSHGSPTWTGAIRGTVPEARIIGAAAYVLHTPPSSHTVHVVDASITGAHLRRAQAALYRGIKIPTSHVINQHALNWVVEGLHRLPRTVGGPHHWVVRQSWHLAAVPLEVPDCCGPREGPTRTPPVAKKTCNPPGA